MLDIKFIREHPEAVANDLKKRNRTDKQEMLDELLKLDAEWRKLKPELDGLRHKRNSLGEEINSLKKQGKDATEQLKAAKELPGRIKADEEREKQLGERMHYILMRLPNVLHESVPEGKDDTENKVIKTWGMIQKKDFELKTHSELAESLGGADFVRATKVAGTGFFFLKGYLALLDQAILRFAIDHLMMKGFTLIEPPLMMNREAYEGVTDLADFENVMYKIDGEEMYLIATSEHPMGAMYMNEVFEPSQLPLKMCGISACFRREIGSHGVDTRGLFRVHQFNKIEQFVFCKPEDSWKIHEEILKNTEEIFQALEIPYRVVAVCTGDIGTVAAKKYDIEAWYPRQNKYGEVASCSNCTSYQAVRLNIKYKAQEGNEYVHTLNNTGIATARAIVAILEHYQNEDGSLTIPKVLQPYMNGMKRIDAK